MAFRYIGETRQQAMANVREVIDSQRRERAVIEADMLAATTSRDKAAAGRLLRETDEGIEELEHDITTLDGMTDDEFNEGRRRYLDNARRHREGKAS